MIVLMFVILISLLCSIEIIVVSELRNRDTSGVFYPRLWCRKYGLKFSEAALKRENELSKLRPKNAANLGQFGNNPDTLGNVAAIRKALEKMREALEKIREKCVIYNNDLAEEIDAICGNALALPPRQCDMGTASSMDAF